MASEIAKIEMNGSTAKPCEGATDTKKVNGEHNIYKVWENKTNQENCEGSKNNLGNCALAKNDQGTCELAKNDQESANSSKDGNTPCSEHKENCPSAGSCVRKVPALFDRRVGAEPGKRALALRTVGWPSENDLEVPGTPKTPRTSTTPGKIFYLIVFQLEYFYCLRFACCY